MRKLIALSVICLTGCDQVPPPQLPPTEYQGLLLKGTAADAKAAGFRQCKSVETVSFECASEKPTTLFGVTASRARVFVSPTNIYNEAGQQSERELTFDGVDLYLGPVSLRRECEITDPSDPNACAVDKTAPLAQFERQLILDGWMSSHRRPERQYVKAGQLVDFDVNPTTGWVKVRGVFGGFAESMIAEISKEPPVLDRHPEADRAAFIESMAK